MCFTLYSHSIQRAKQHTANMEIVVYLLGNSCAPSVAKKAQKTFYIKFTQKRCNNWHMISFIHSGIEKRVYRFPSGNNLADAGKELTCYMGT